MEPGPHPVARRLAAGLGSVRSLVAAVPARAARRAGGRERERAELAALRLEPLQSLAAELAGALTTAQITDLLMTRGIAALRADGAAVFMIEPGDDALTAIAWRGHSDTRALSMARLPLGVPMPATDVARTGEPVFIEDPEAYVARYAETFRALGLPPQPRAIAAVPLEVEERRFGVLGFNWNHPTRWSPTGRRSSPRSAASAPGDGARPCSMPSVRRSTGLRPPSGASNLPQPRAGARLQSRLRGHPGAAGARAAADGRHLRGGPPVRRGPAGRRGRRPGLADAATAIESTVSDADGEHPAAGDA
jgi:hypothetical protein